MSTEKPVIQAIISPEHKAIFDKICEKEKRTKSNLAGMILEEWIEKHKKKEVQ
jgi:hypothetical protein